MPDNSNSKSNSNSFSLYAHIPFCRTKCRYCAFYSVPVDKYDAGNVTSAIIAELQQYKLGKSIKNLYIGGGCPNSLPKEHLLRLVKQLMQKCPSTEEFTVEVNPGQVDKPLLKELHKTGVNRLSIGAQSFIQHELDFLGRDYTASCIRKSVQRGRAAGFNNINLDLIFAIPGSCLDSWKQNLRSAVELHVEHISAYALTYENHTPIGNALAAGRINPIDEDTDRAMYEITIDELENAGLHQYEISNFAVSGSQCRHNLNYWANGPYIGIGPGATTYLNGTRSTNLPDIDSYLKSVKNNESTVAETETLTGLEFACETAVLNLRRRCGINLAEFKKRTGFDAYQLFAAPIRMYEKQGLINTENGHTSLARKALAIADSILCDFAAV